MQLYVHELCTPLTWESKGALPRLVLDASPPSPGDLQQMNRIRSK
jgi:hypothetical protein